jgi:hypothetical protein
MADQLAGMDALPEQYGSLAAGFRSAAARLAQSSAGQSPSRILPTNVFIRSAEMNTRLFVTQSSQGLLFGFIRRGSETRLIMDITVNFRFEITNRQFRSVEIKPGDLIHTATVPLFFLADPSEETAQDAAGALGVDRQEIFFIQLDAGILAVSRPEDASLARVAWQKFPGAPWARADGNPGSSHGGRWQVPPFLALARTVGLWVKRGIESGAQVPVVLPDQEEEASSKTALFTLRRLTDAWIEATNGIRNLSALPENTEPVSESLTPEYNTAGFNARVLLRLDPEGRLAPKGERDDLFLLQAGLRVEEDDHEIARSSITLGPPDFLGGGSLYEAFLDCLEEPDPVQTLASQLGLKGREAAVLSFIRSARSSQLEAPLVFRVKHGKPDTDVITLHGTLNALLQHVVLEAKFDVEMPDPPKVHLRKGSLEVLYTDRPAEGSPEPKGDEFVRYFLRLLTNLRNWQKALK